MATTAPCGLDSAAASATGIGRTRAGVVELRIPKQRRRSNWRRQRHYRLPIPIFILDIGKSGCGFGCGGPSHIRMAGRSAYQVGSALRMISPAQSVNARTVGERCRFFG